jgi:hypothetical protein
VQRRAAERRTHKVEERSKAAQKRQAKATERQRIAAERIARLTSILMGTHPEERITSEERWNMATSELQSLWLRSGDKECVSCRTVVPPTAMHPPGPANFYPGKCRSCARMEREESLRRTFGPLIGPLWGPRKIPMKDGTSITVAEFARRVRERKRVLDR